MFRALWLIAATTYATAFALVPVAHANGDPPSNVLLNQGVYFPDAGTSAAERELAETVDEAGSAGYEVKVALVLTPRDLGNIPQFFHQPEGYAAHLADELGFAWRGDVAVVMPDGVGVQSPVKVADKRAAVARIRPAGGDPDDLARAGERAVRALASAAGVEVGGSGDSVVPALLVLGGLLLAGGGAAAWRIRAGTPGADHPEAPEGEPGGKGDLQPEEQRGQ